MIEEKDSHEGTQAARYLAADAERAYLLRAGDRRMQGAGESIACLLASGRDVIAESNRLVSCIQERFCQERN